jgi:hypothetical protein
MVRLYVLQLACVVTSETTKTVAVEQLSEAVGGVNTGCEGQKMVALAPALPIVGAVVSTTLIVWLTVPLLLPQASSACQVLVLE